MRCPAKCRRVGMADDADSKSVGGNTVWVQVPPPAPRRNGLRSIQKAQPKGWAFLIPLRHSSFSPQNFAVQTFVGTPPYGPRRGAGINFITQTHVGMDCAPFKKPSRKAGLFSYRSVIPPSPHKTLLRKFSWGPRPPCRTAPHCAPFKKSGPLAGLSLLFSFRSGTSLAARAFSGENAHGSTALLAHLCRHSQLRGVTFV